MTIKITPSAVINWFKNLTPKENRRFIKFDIWEDLPGRSS